jgi:ABC-type glycerol-3-phosphate transport system permease component
VKRLGFVFLGILLLIAAMGPYVTVVGGFTHWEYGSLIDVFLLRRLTLNNFKFVVTYLSNQTSSAPGILFRWLWNSIVLGTMTATMQVITCIPAGWAMARYDFMGKRFLRVLLVVMMSVPTCVMFVPLYVVVYKLGLRGMTGVAISLAVLASTVLLTMQYAASLGTEVFESARMDGANDLEILWYIAMPLLKPMVISTWCGGFMGIWNNILWVTVMLKSQGNWTIAQAVLFASNYWKDSDLGTGRNIGAISALSLIALIIPTILYLISQKYVVKGMEGLIKE